MKKKIYTIIFCGLGTTAYGQLDYTFAADTATYIELDTSAHHVNDAWDNPFSYTYMDPIGVDFFNITTDHTRFYLNGHGEVEFDAYFTGEHFYVSGYGIDLVGHHGFTVGNLDYKMEGTSGNRILKVQYKDCGFYIEGAPHSSYVNFQIWIYENGDKVELRYGASSVDAGLGNVCKAGIYDVDLSTTNSVEVTGTISSPSIAAGNHDLGSGLSGTPAANTVYRFTPKSTNVNKLISSTPKAYYSADNKIIYIKWDHSIAADNINLYNIFGQKVIATVEWDGNRYTIPVQNLIPGLYIAKIKENESSYSLKFSVN